MSGLSWHLKLFSAVVTKNNIQIGYRRALILVFWNICHVSKLSIWNKSPRFSISCWQNPCPIVIWQIICSLSVLSHNRSCGKKGDFYLLCGLIQIIVQILVSLSNTCSPVCCQKGSGMARLKAHPLCCFTGGQPAALTDLMQMRASFARRSSLR